MRNHDRANPFPSTLALLKGAKIAGSAKFVTKSGRPTAKCASACADMYECARARSAKSERGESQMDERVGMTTFSVLFFLSCCLSPRTL